MGDATTADGAIAFVDLAAQRRALAGADLAAIETVLEHGQFIMGPEVAKLEAALAERVGVKHVVSCGSGTDALLLPLLGWGVGSGDAVFVPSFTFTATAEVVALLGATPVFCDVDPETFNMDAESLERAIGAVRRDGALKPRAIIPVDLFGQPANYRAIHDVAQDGGLLILADAAQSFGAALAGRPVGSLAHATATSFFPAKPLGCFGDGGAVFTDDEALASDMRSLRVHGQGRSKYETVRVGLNARLDTLQAAVLLTKLATFDDELRARARVADFYRRELPDGVTHPTVADTATPAWAQYTVRLRHRDEMSRVLRSMGIPSAIYYPTPLHLQPAFVAAGRAPAGCGVAERLAQQVLSLPMHPYLTCGDLHRIADGLEAALSRLPATEV
jgi:UDP-2-acetamido-2-deoxy-ribo-hexuluronate aminotransferase